MKLFIQSATFFAFLLTCAIFSFKEEPQLDESLIGEDVSKILDKIPKRDQDSLCYFFRQLIGWDQFGYVLLGDKPMAFSTVETHINPFQSLDHFRSYIAPRRIKMVKGFKVWQKYEKFFPLSKYAILYDKAQDNNQVIILVNKEAFIRKVMEHKQDFEKILKCVDGKKIIDEARVRPLISNLLINHEALLGILLGYGRENAYLFYQRSQLNSLKEAIDFNEKYHLQSPWSVDECEEFKKQFESISWISNYITGSHLSNLHLMAPPSFLCQPESPQTKALKRKFIETKQVIIDFYKEKDFLKATLELLAS